MRKTPNLSMRDAYYEWGAWADAARSPSTAMRFQGIAEQFMNADKLWDKRPGDISLQRMLKFVNKGGARPTREIRKMALRSFWKFMMARGMITHNDAEVLFVDHRNMSFEELEPEPRFALTPDEVWAVVQAATPVWCGTGFWHIAVRLSWCTGLRLGDICSLQRASTERVPDALIVWTRKRSKRVALPVDDPLLGNGELRRVIADLRALPIDSEAFYFPQYHSDYSGAHASRIKMQAHRLFKSAGVTGPGKSFHSLRHSAVSRWAAAGKTLEEIGRWVGHSDEETTAGYVHDESAAAD